MPIELARSEDLRAISIIESEAYHPELVTSLNAFEKQFSSLSSENLLVIYRGESGVCGFCHFALNKPEAGGCALWDVAVAKSEQGKGIGKELVDHVIRTARTAGMSRVFLHVPEDNLIARKIYERAGFSVTGRLFNYYPPQGSRSGEFTVDGLAMDLLI